MNSVYSHSGRQTEWATDDWVTLCGRLGDTFWSTGRHESGQLGDTRVND